MSAKTGIQWTDHTFNIAWGCTKVSAGCASCYAETASNRFGFDVWGPGKERRTFGEKHWNEPRKWNRDAEKEGRRHRVFCSSMCDVFEDHPTIFRERLKLWDLIAETPWLDWQILTKRADILQRTMLVTWPNAWFGVSVEDQKTADERIPLLLRTPSAVRFVSAEPLLGPVDFTEWTHWSEGDCGCSDCEEGSTCDRGRIRTPALDWVIVGGESGPNARPFDIAWARKTVEDCRAAGVPVFVKQLGAKPTGRSCDCGEHRTDIEEKDIAEVLYAEYKEGDYAESNGLALVRLTNGQYAVIEEWEDTSGHG